MKLLNLREAILLICNKNITSYLETAHLDKWTEISKDDISDEVIIDGIREGKRDLMLRYNKRSGVVLFRDDLTTPVGLEMCWGVDEEITKPRYLKLLDDVKKYDAEFLYGCVGNDDYDWMDLTFKVGNFEKEKLIKCVELWDEYNLEMRKYEAKQLLKLEFYMIKLKKERFKNDNRTKKRVLQRL